MVLSASEALKKLKGGTIADPALGAASANSLRIASPTTDVLTGGRDRRRPARTAPAGELLGPYKRPVEAHASDADEGGRRPVSVMNPSRMIGTPRVEPAEMVVVAAT